MYGPDKLTSSLGLVASTVGHARESDSQALRKAPTVKLENLDSERLTPIVYQEWAEKSKPRRAQSRPAAAGVCWLRASPVALGCRGSRISTDSPPSGRLEDGTQPPRHPTTCSVIA